MNKREDISGQVFTRWKAIDINEKKSKETGRTYWNVICTYEGNKGCVSISDLKSRHSRSCGCLKKEMSFGKNHPRWKEKIIIICKQCGKEKEVIPSKKETQFCSKKCYSQWMSENSVGKNNPHWNGGKVTIICKWCGKEKEVWSYLEEVAQFCSKKCEGKWMSENGLGKNSPNWKGGTTPLGVKIRTSKEYLDFIQIILKKSNYTCKMSQEVGGTLNVHHIKSFAKILEENNITTKKQALDCKELWDEKNVVVLSEKWHSGIKSENPYAFHRLYGWKDFTEEDFYKWFNTFNITKKYLKGTTDEN